MNKLTFLASVSAAALLAPSLALAQTTPAALSIAGSLPAAAFDVSAPKFGGAALIPSAAGFPVSIATGMCDLRNALSQVWTVSLWVKFPATLPTNTQAIISIGGLYLAEASSAFSGGGLTLSNFQQTLDITAVAPNDANGSSDLTDGLWHHVEIDNGGYPSGSTVLGPWVYVFVDGKTLTGLNESIYGTGGRAGTITLGSLPSGFSNEGTFSGELDEVTLWNGLQHPLPTLFTFGTNSFILPGTQTFTPQTAAYVGTETNLKLLYHLDQNGVDNGPTFPASPVEAGGSTAIVQPTCGW